MFREFSNPGEHIFQEATFLACSYHRDGQFVEGFRVLGHGIGQAGTIADLCPDILQHGRKSRYSCLTFDNFEAAQQGHAGVE